MQNVAVEVKSCTTPWPYRGPYESQTTPMRIREKTAPVTEAMAPPDKSCLVRLRSSLMTGTSGGTAKVAQKAMKNDIHDSWKAR